MNNKNKIYVLIVFNYVNVNNSMSVHSKFVAYNYC